MVKETERLEMRPGLPEALRVLLEEYPREAWDADPGFSGLIRFWLDRHLMFRRLLAAMVERGEAAAEGKTDPRRFAAELSRLGSLFTGELHGHHMIEDQHYFPRLRGLDARVEHGFDLLDADHQDLDAHLSAFAETANAAIRDIAEDRPHDAALQAFLAGLEGTGRFLDRHLTDEEDLIVPVLLKYGSDGLG
jgi:iron-sulfur cluster repair protein YtfE (RIC family)